jgi:Mn2+/Fe2+ NRAMP family transporter
VCAQVVAQVNDLFAAFLQRVQHFIRDEQGLAALLDVASATFAVVLILAGWAYGVVLAYCGVL